jgi:predicted deacetylase
MFSKIKNYISDNTGILIRIDDIAENMNWDLMEKSELLFEKYGIKPVLGVIPENKDTTLLSYPKKNDFWEKVRIWKNKGWEIAMHGYTHVYDKETKRNDYFNHGGNSEFCGHSLETQELRIKKGLKKFDSEKIKIRAFFAPNHTYDQNTFVALKNNGINEIIDGYGLMPYSENNIKFIPQLFYKVFALPFGIQSTQIHLNYWEQKDFDNFEKFIINNSNKIITYDEALKKVNNNFFHSSIKNLSAKILKLKRIIKN